MLSTKHKKASISLLATMLCFLVITGGLCGDVPQPLVAPTILEYDHVWASDSSSIMTTKRDGTVFRIDKDAHELFEFHVDDRMTFVQFAPSASMDGRILYSGILPMPSTFRRPPWQLFIRDTYYGFIRTANLEGNDERELRRIVGGDFDHPTWSPDGTQIAFTQQRRGATGYQFAVMNADGSDMRVYDEVIDPDALVWSPDGSHVAVVEQLRAKQVRNDDKFHYKETIDSDRLSVVRLSDGFTRRLDQFEFSDVVRYNLMDDGSVSYSDSIDYEPWGNEVIRDKLEWSAKNDRIYYLMNRYATRRSIGTGGTYGGEVVRSTIYSINTDGTDRRIEFESGKDADITSFDLSPDDEKILFILEPNSTEYFRHSGQDSVHVMNLNNTVIRRLVGDFAWHERAVWSPDGSKIAFSAEFEVDGGYVGTEKVYAHGGLFVMNSDGTNARLLVRWDHERNISLNEESWRIDPNESILVGVDYE